jgi:hypothetical protein
MEKITERMKSLIESRTTELKKYKELEELTGITAASWRSWWNRGGPPSGEMIEAVGAIWPECAFWLVTGIDDHHNGHHRAVLHERQMARSVSRDLFLATIALNKWLTESGFDPADYAKAVNEGRVEPNDHAKNKTYFNLSSRVHALEQIRAEQEASALKYETEASQQYWLGEN